MRQLKITKSITNRESASLDKYLQEIGKEELITVEEEVELAQRIKKGDQEALGEAHQSQPAFRGVRRQTIPESGIEPPGPDQRGQPRADQGRREVRRDPRFQVHLLCRVVDSSVDSPGFGRAVAHRASAAQPGGFAEQDQQGVRTLRAGARAHAVARRAGYGTGTPEGEGHRHAACRRPPRIGRRSVRRRRGQLAAGCAW